MGFDLSLVEGDNIVIHLPKDSAKQKWELAKKIVDMYFENPGCFEAKETKVKDQ